MQNMIQEDKDRLTRENSFSPIIYDSSLLDELIFLYQILD